jgi:tetratricopeptide (TPR) repeat protein
MLAFEKAVSLSNLGRASEAAPIYSAIAARTTGQTRLSSLKEQARSAMAAGDFAGAAEILATVPVGELSSDDRRLFNLALVQIATKRLDVQGLVTAYTSATVGLRADDREAMHQMIFSTIIETSDHIAIEEEVRRRLAANPSLPGSLWYLAAEAANASRRLPNRIEAHYRLCLALPGDYEALRALAAAVSPIAADLAAVPENMLSVPKAEINKLLQISADALAATVRANPMDPDNYRPLLAFHQAIGTSETAVSAAISVVAAGSSIPAVKGVAAYALAINGYPDAAIKLYDEAVAMAPKDMHILMNRASCWTRLGRWDEALNFYYKILEEGFEGQAYHIHELVDRIWKIEKHLGRPERALAKFREILGRIPPERITDAAESMGVLMLNEKRWDDSLGFFREQQARSPEIEERGHAGNFIGQVYLRSGRPLDAAKAYADAAKVNRQFPNLWVESMHGQAQSLFQGGQSEEAIKVLRETATELPNHSLAATSLFRIAQIHEQGDNREEALKAYREFLQSSSTDLTLRQAAEERIADLETTATSQLTSQ